jgi:hypothetical protein
MIRKRDQIFQETRAMLRAVPAMKPPISQIPAAKQQQITATFRARLSSLSQYVRPLRSISATANFPGLDLTAPFDMASETVTPAVNETGAAPAKDLTDADMDKLPDKFERRLANKFAPLYHISADETEHFATFVDQPTLAIASVGPTTPPIAHYRVVPLGYATSQTGAKFGVIQIDYLTVWSNDSGLEAGFGCVAALGLLGLALDGLGNHSFDEERSSVLVLAPAEGTPARPQLSTNPASYRAHLFYTAAHEGVVPFDHSVFIRPDAPLDSGIQLWLSHRKHSTYHFNPNKFPIFREEIIALVYATINDLYASGTIDDLTYAALVGAADNAFFDCVVERFREQGGTFATPLTNVGEPAQPINGCGWINDSRIAAKLTPPIFLKVLAPLQPL